MKAINVDTLEWFQVTFGADKQKAILILKPHINDLDIIDAEPVRHTENTTVIDTDNVKEWKSRIMVCERNSHWGRLYYESDTKHGKWLETDYFDAHKVPIYKCSVCFREVADHYIKCHKYCLHCGTKMDLED